jgi:hypothetical protein
MIKLASPALQRRSIPCWRKKSGSCTRQIPSQSEKIRGGKRPKALNANRISSRKSRTRFCREDLSQMVFAG